MNKKTQEEVAKERQTQTVRFRFSGVGVSIFKRHPFRKSLTLEHNMQILHVHPHTLMALLRRFCHTSPNILSGTTFKEPF